MDASQRKSVKPPSPRAAEDLSPKTLVYTAKEVDRLQPQHHGYWIREYPGDVFVVFDPTTDGSGILGAARTLEEAEAILNAHAQQDLGQLVEADRRAGAAERELETCRANEINNEYPTASSKLPSAFNR